MDASQDWLEGIVKKRAEEEAPTKIVEFETVPQAMGGGVNYQSKIGLIRAKVLLGSGKTKKLSLIVKDQHDNGPMQMLSGALGVFNREITMYRDVLPKMENVLEEIGDTEGRFWPFCYEMRPYDRLILEDLRDLGYRTANKKEIYELDAALLTIKQIGKFHALTRTLLDRGEVPTDLFGTHVFDNPTAAAFLVPMMTQNFVKFTGAVERWGDEWKPAAKKLKKLDTGGSLMEAFRADPSEFTVLGHGDCWLNNILLKGEDIQRPSSVWFIDFQQSFIASPAVDLIHFLVASVKVETRDKHLDELLQAYHDSLKSCLEKTGREGPTPTIDDIKAAVNKRGLLQLWFAVALAPQTMDSFEIPDMDKMTPEIMEMITSGNLPPELDIFNRLEPQTVKLLQYEVKRAIDNGHL